MQEIAPSFGEPLCNQFHKIGLCKHVQLCGYVCSFKTKAKSFTLVNQLRNVIYFPVQMTLPSAGFHA